MKIYPENLMPKKKSKALTGEELRQKKELAKQERIKKQIQGIIDNPDIPVTRTAYAHYVGVTLPTLREWVKKGNLELNKDGLIVPRQADQARSLSSTAKPNPHEDSSNPSASSRLVDLKTLKAEQDLRIATAKADEIERRLVRRDDVDQYYYTVATETRKAFQALDKAVIHKMFIPNNRQHEATQVLKAAIEDILTALATKLGTEE